MPFLLSLLITTSGLAGPLVGDPDIDKDGIHEYFDACPFEAEDLDGYRDEDGCNDPTSVRFVFVDAHGVQIDPDVDIVGVGPLPHRRLLRVPLKHGDYTISAQADGYEPLVARVTVPDGYQHRIELVMEVEVPGSTGS